MYDYHVHSKLSPDSTMEMKAACLAAIEKGVKEIAFTDHLDYFYPNCDLVFEFDYTDYEENINKVIELFKGKLTIKKAVEVGIHRFSCEKSKQFTDQNYFDFILGSVHLADDLDLHNGDFFKNKTLHESITKYFETINQAVKDYQDFNVLSHLTLIKRYLHYVNSDWRQVRWEDYFDIIEDIFKTLIDTSRGIEVNLSGYRYRLDCALPELPFLKFYRSLGGEIITVGTDAHSEHFVGEHLRTGYKLLDQAGFKYVSTFSNRKPSFHPLKEIM